MREFANKNFAKGAGTKAMNALSDPGADLVIEYGAEPLDPNEPNGKAVVEFVVSKPLDQFSPEDQAILADHRVTLDSSRGQTMTEVTTANTQAQAAGAEALTDAPAGAPWEDQGSPLTEATVTQSAMLTDAPVGHPDAPVGQADPATVRAEVDATTNPTPAHPKAPEVQATQEVTEWNGRKETLPIPRGAGRKFLPVRNDVAYPASYTQTRDVWDTFDALSRKAERIILLHEARAVLEPQGFTSNTISTQYARWCQFWGYSKEMRAEVRKQVGATEATPGEETEAEKELKALKEREKALKKEAKALETQEAKRLKALEKEAERAAKRRSEEEAKALQRKHQSEEWAKQRDARIASNQAVRDERLAKQLADQRAKLEQQERQLEARRQEAAAREARAKANLEARLAGQPEPFPEVPAPTEPPAPVPALQQAPGGDASVAPDAGPALEVNEPAPQA